MTSPRGCFQTKTIIVDKEFLNNLSAEAKANHRLRQAYDLRTTSEDQSQRILNALKPGTVLPIHRHRNTAETMIVIRGSVKELLYDDNGNFTSEYIMTPQSEYPMIQIEVGQYSRLKSWNRTPSSLKQRMGLMNH